MKNPVEQRGKVSKVMSGTDKNNQQDGTSKENEAAADSAKDAELKSAMRAAKDAAIAAAREAASESSNQEQDVPELSENDVADALDALGGIEAEQKTYEELATENEALKDRLLRALSDTENMRRRAQREKEDAHKYAITAFARDLLEVSDNLTRALTSVSPEDKAAGGPQLATLIEGVELTEKGLLSAFEKHKIQLVAPKGERFDPNFHQAVAEIPGTDQPHGTVVDVMQTGYTIGDRLLRPAMVTVAKGDPAQKEEAAGDPGEPGDNVDTSA